MNRRFTIHVVAAVLLFVMPCGWANASYAQASSQEIAAPSEVHQSGDELAPSKALRAGNVGTLILDSHAWRFWNDLLPNFDAAALTWIAVVVILVLTIQARPILCWHNLDGLILALTALLLPLRGNTELIPNTPTGHTVQWWVYALLCAICAYWSLRGVRLLLGKTVPTMTANVNTGALFILIVAGLFLAGSRVAGAPLSDGSRDGLTGGVFFAEKMKLPYGDAPGYDGRSPLLYLLHAGAVQVVEPACEVDGESTTMTWMNREQWMTADGWNDVDPAPARLVNAVLFILLFTAVAGIGHRLHSVALGQTLAALLCVFPGVLECLPHPEIMLPAALVAWSIAFLTIPGIGGFLAVLTLALAGLAWAWVWLVMIVVLAYLLRRGWQAFGGILGLCAGIVLIVLGLDTFAAPTLPNPEASLREAGLAPAYAARMSDDGTIVIEPNHPEMTPAPTIKKWLWLPLLNKETVRLNALNLHFAYPNGIDGGAIACRDVLADSAARMELQREYRTAMQSQEHYVQTLAALRTTLEATWKAEHAPDPAALPGAWELWSETRPGWNWDLVRRYIKILCGVFALLVALLLFRDPAARLPRLVGGLLAVGAAIMLIDFSGPATNWVWLMPMILACLAAKGAPSAAPPPLNAARAVPKTPPLGNFPPMPSAPAPRITVEK